MEVIEYFTGKWKSMENEAGCAWMKEYQGRRLMLHMAVWEDAFLEDGKRILLSKGLSAAEIFIIFSTPVLRR